jgi:GNAT superfamily N-acetyltransferase
MVAELDGRVAGFAAVVGGELDGLFVEPELWRQGIGAALVDAATHAARGKGLALTVVATRPHAASTSAAAFRSKATRRRASDLRSGCRNSRQQFSSTKSLMHPGISNFHTSNAGACPR